MRVYCFSFVSIARSGFYAYIVFSPHIMPLIKYHLWRSARTEDREAERDRADSQAAFLLISNRQKAPPSPSPKFDHTRASIDSGRFTNKKRNTFFNRHLT